MKSIKSVHHKQQPIHGTKFSCKEGTMIFGTEAAWKTLSRLLPPPSKTMSSYSSLEMTPLSSRYTLSTLDDYPPMIPPAAVRPDSPTLPLPLFQVEHTTTVGDIQSPHNSFAPPPKQNQTRPLVSTFSLESIDKSHPSVIATTTRSIEVIKITEADGRIGVGSSISVMGQTEMLKVERLWKRE
jgi:hypothetical protein